MEQEIIERNKVIFDFMGCKHSDDELIDKWEMETLKYHRDWSWIMPVWIKFRKLWTDRGALGIAEEKYYGEWLSSLEYYLCSSDEPGRFAERLHNAILWYNSQVKETIKP